MPRDDDDDGDSGKARWLTTYGDAMTLLLVFFVLLLSMSTINPQTFQIVISSFQGAIGVFEGGRTLSPARLMNMGLNVHELSEAESTVSQNIPKEVERIIQLEEQNAKVKRDERGLVIQVTNRLLFASGQTEVTDQGVDFLGNISTLLKAPGIRERQVRVEGHTDNVPADDFQSNWQISVLRSANVVEVLTNEYGVDGGRLSAVGFGSQRPIASNETEAGRSQNRRVEIVILRDDVQNGQ
jgi:chemotaxis protein MotB